MDAAPLTVEQQAEFEHRLVDESARAAAQQDALTRTYTELVDAADLEPPDDEHDPDGTTAYERAQVASLLDQTRRTLLDLVAARERLVDGTYGACTQCGGPVGVDRLTVLPATPRCIACAVR